eukprot:NODE_3394_length_976_cov_10.944641_g3248_i0.p1 GENE.NODE_3394_length_976_cov_10.944641_g3248_i0~~NODE_3394_length_976_cov_10.944641_g3248_i0.p1  ORF type:complete len:296 (+),score=54.38 NODE_3394_length_976_cov_10.944641_g3248_i0:87-974(+)
MSDESDTDPSDNEMGITDPFPMAEGEEVPEFSALTAQLPDISRLLERVMTRMDPSQGRLDTLLLQVLLARVSLAEMQYQTQLREALRQSLDEAQDKPQGAPPASDEDIAHLPTVPYCKEHQDYLDSPTCPVCLTPFRLGTPVTQLPCAHLFCEPCILTWLSEHATCPLCRSMVVNVPESPYTFTLCGYRQLDSDRCGCCSLRLVTLPYCSHGFSPICLKANLTPTLGPGTTVMIECPLCSKPSPVCAAIFRPDSNATTPPVRRHPLLNREPVSWRRAKPPETEALALPEPPCTLR